jgi:hypothetical protein
MNITNEFDMYEDEEEIDEEEIDEEMHQRMSSTMNITDKFDMREDEDYLIDFHQPNFAKWNGIYKLIQHVRLEEYDHFNVEHYVFRNSNGLTIVANLFMEQWSALVKNNYKNLCESSDEIYIDEEGTYSDNISFVRIDVIYDDKEERWENRADFLCYLESSESQVKSNLTNVLNNKDLTRYITNYL